MYDLTYINKTGEGSCSVEINEAQEALLRLDVLLESGIDKNNIQVIETIDNQKYGFTPDDFKARHTIGEDPKILEIQNDLMFYNFERQEFEDGANGFVYEKHVMESYHNERNRLRMTFVLDDDKEAQMCTIVEGDDTWFYLCLGYKFVNRMGYVIVKPKTADAISKLKFADFKI